MTGILEESVKLFVGVLEILAVYLKFNASSQSYFSRLLALNFISRRVFEFQCKQPFLFPVYYSIEFIFQARNLDSHHKE